MTIDELKAEIRNNPDGKLMMAYRIGYSEGLKDKSIELSKSIETLFSQVQQALKELK
jgi:hypothetical protein